MPNEFDEINDEITEAELEQEEAMVTSHQAKVHQALVTRDTSALITEPSEGALSAMNLATVLLAHPEKFDQFLETWERGHKNLKAFAVRSTLPEDWVISKPRDPQGGHVPDTEALGYCSAPGCVKMRAPLGISILNPRGPEYSVVEIPGSPGPDGKVKVTQYPQARFVADGLNGLTGERAFGIEGIRTGNEQFIGRADKGHAHDLGQAARTLCEAKITRLLSGVPRMPALEIAKLMGLSLDQFVARARRGSGYGTSRQRSQAREEVKQANAPVAEKGTSTAASGDLADALWAAINEQTAGDEEASLNMLRYFSEFEGDKGPVWLKSIEQARNKPKWLQKTVRKFEEHFEGVKVGGGQ